MYTNVKKLSCLIEFSLELKKQFSFKQFRLEWVHGLDKFDS